MAQKNCAECTKLFLLLLEIKSDLIRILQHKRQKAHSLTFRRLPEGRFSIEILSLFESRDFPPLEFHSVNCLCVRSSLKLRQNLSGTELEKGEKSSITKTKTRKFKWENSFVCA